MVVVGGADVTTGTGSSVLGRAVVVAAGATVVVVDADVGGAVTAGVSAVVLGVIATT